MPSPRREQELLDHMWERVRPLLPARTPNPKGGRPWADDKACFAGVVYALRNGIRWNVMPRCFPSGVTCWRRHRDWTADEVSILEDLEITAVHRMWALLKTRRDDAQY